MRRLILVTAALVLACLAAPTARGDALDDFLVGMTEGWREAATTPFSNIWSIRNNALAQIDGTGNSWVPPYVPENDLYPRPRHVIYGWTGANWRSCKGIFTGGGHGGWGGNAIFQFDYCSLTWSRVTPESVQEFSTAPDGQNGTGPDGVNGTADDNFNGTGLDYSCPYPKPNGPSPGVPSSKHTYNGNVYHPGRNSMFLIRGVDFCSKSPSFPSADGRQDYADMWEYDFDTLAWTKRPDPPGGTASTQINGSVVVNNIIYMHNQSGLHSYDPDGAGGAGAWTQIATNGAAENALTYDPVLNKLILWEGPGSGARVKIFDLSGGTPTQLQLVGDVPSIDVMRAGGHNFDSLRQVWVIWGGGCYNNPVDVDASSIWTAVVTTSSATFTKRTYPSGPLSAQVTAQSAVCNGVYSKWYYDASKDIHIGYANVDQGFWFYRAYSLEGGALPPNAGNDSCTTVTNTSCTGNVLSNDSDPNNPPLALTASNPTTPANGGVALQPGGSYIYTPNTGFTGQDSWCYTLTNSAALTDTGCVSITINAAGNNPPVLEDDAFSVNYAAGPSYSDTVAANDTNDDGAVIYTLEDPPTHGSVVVNANGTFVYTLQQIFWGTDQFTVRGVDQGNNQDTSVVTLSIGCEGAVPPPPQPEPGTPGVCP